MQSTETPGGEREAIAKIVLDHFHAPDELHPSWWIRPHDVADAIMASPEWRNRGRGPIADAEIQRLREVVYRQTGCSWYQTPEQARAALEAALDAEVATNRASHDAFWRDGKPAPETGQVWRRKRNGRLVTVIDAAARPSGNFVDVMYDMGEGRVGYSSSLYWHATFEPTGEADPVAHTLAWLREELELMDDGRSSAVNVAQAAREYLHKLDQGRTGRQVEL